jgi:hypothetical protein
MVPGGARVVIPAPRGRQEFGAVDVTPPFVSERPVELDAILRDQELAKPPAPRAAAAARQDDRPVARLSDGRPQPIRKDRLAVGMQRLQAEL